MPISLNPKDAVKGGLALSNGAIGTMQHPRFFSTHTKNGSPMVALVDDILLQDGTVVPNQYWSGGSPERLFPCDAEGNEVPQGQGGEYLDSRLGLTGISDSCNLKLFMDSLQKNGCPDTLFAGPISFLDGLQVAWTQAPGTKVDPNDKERTVAVIEKIISAPWDKKTAGAGKGRTATAAGKVNGTAAAASAAAVNDDEVQAITAEIIGLIMGDKPGEVIAKPRWSALFYQYQLKSEAYKGADDATKKAVLKQYNDAAFLANMGVGVDAKTGVTIPA